LREILFISVAGMTVMVLQTISGGLVIPAEYKPDLMLILVLWAAVRSSLLIGLGFAFISGLFLDLFSGAPAGLFALINCLVFVATGSLNSRFAMDRVSARTISVFGASLLAALLVVSLRWATGPVELGARTMQWIVAKSAISALASLLLFPVLDKFWTGYCRIIGAR